MSQGHWQNELRIPAALTEQLRDFRRRVWTIKLAEALAVAAVSVLAAFLSVFLVDRLFDTPAWLRAAIGAAALVGCSIVPWFLHRWVWRFQRLEQLARLLSRKMPAIGDQLLGILELARNRWEQSRSLTLCQAAIEQVADDARQTDFLAATPGSRVRTWTISAAALLLLVSVVSVLVPAAAQNAWARLTRPWSDTPRFTFADIENLPAEIVVAHGEPFTFQAKLADKSRWRPATAHAQIAGQPAAVAPLADGSYRFEFSAQIEPASLRLRVGDLAKQIRVEPKLRPELVSIVALNRLPDYLGQPGTQEQDIRSGAISLVKGSRVKFMPTANRPLRSARAGDAPYDPDGATFTTAELLVDDARQISLEWRDEFGLTCKEPFNVAITALEDEAPQISCEGLPRGRVVLDTEQLVFQVRASDDFGVQNVGMVWKGMPSELVETSASGTSVLAVGGHDKAALDVLGTFTASSLGIEPQAIELRLFATDYYPDRKPVYTAPYLLFVLDAEQHAIWVTEQLAKWHRQSLQVRDRELQLYETNKKLRDMAAADLDQPEARRQIERQADAERANGRRLANLTEAGKELLRQAARNPEIGVGHLDKWAEMLQILADISANRMPSVADLLKDAAVAPQVAASARRANSGPAVGQVRASNAGGGSENQGPKKPAATAGVPQVVDVESSQEPQEPLDSATPKDSKPSNPTLRLPVTTLVGRGKPRANAPDQNAQETVEEAVTQQRDLLAEFEKVANELNAVLANLEGSTLVKRLKAAARQHYAIAGRLNDHIEEAFGTTVVAPPLPRPSDIERLGWHGAYRPPVRSVENPNVPESFKKLSSQVDEGIEKISYIMDDMAAYFERRRMVQFKLVLDDMRQQDVLGGLRQLSDDLPIEQGLSISQCEYWSDTLDRWAEDLVDPACSGACPGCRAKGCLPPSIVLEVLQILEGEINLREETRVAEQAKSAVDTEKHTVEAKRLGNTQKTLDGRVVKVVERIRQLPDAEADFAKEIALLGQVSAVMKDAAQILAKPETGPPAIAAETEAIELLLQSKRVNPNGGGGGGSSPGGGGGGNTQDSALALLGAGLNPKEVREDRGTVHAVGDTGPVWPEEFRAGLDQYFSRLESDAD
ncbi:MAG TPA: hypothetical protein VGK58_06290 [Lacipirellulaceae bacterium]